MTAATVTKPSCAARNCPKTRDRLDWCFTHYEKRRLAGYTGAVASGPVFAHLDRLAALGWDPDAIADAADVSVSCIYSMRRERRTKCHMETARRILSVEPVSMLPIGAVRRVQALMRIGWLKWEIAEAASYSTSALTALMYRGSASFALVAAIHKAYRELSDRIPPIPDEATAAARRTGRTKAAQKDWLAPAAWDDIDDPGENLDVEVGTDDVDEVAVQRVLQGRAKPSSLTLPERYAAAKAMVEKGVAPSTAATKLGLNRRNVAEVTERLAA